jgi:hypothetical protein
LGDLGLGKLALQGLPRLAPGSAYVASARPHFRASVGTSLEDATFVLHMIAKQIPYRYPNIKFMNDRLRPYAVIQLRILNGSSCEGFRTTAHRDSGAGTGPSSESPQGRNPRGGEVWKAPRAMAI